MAIEFSHMGIVSAGDGSSAVGLSAYINREIREDEITGQRFDFTKNGTDLIHKEVMLPENAPERFRDGSTMWNEAEKAERVFDRKTQEWRWRKGPTIDGKETSAQFAKHLILALPKELKEQEQIELARRYVQDRFVSKGVAAEFAIHSDGENPHAHVMVSTRSVDAEGFGKKARDLNPTFNNGRIASKDEWGADWARYQNAYFQEIGANIRVDPTAAEPSRHLSKEAWHAKGEAREAAEALKEANREAVKDPEKVLDAVSKTNAYWTERDVATVLFKGGLEGAEFDKVKAQVMGHANTVPLFNPETGDRTEFFTTRAVREAELKALGDATIMQGRGGYAVSEAGQQATLKQYSLDPDQLKAFKAATDDQGLAVWRGVAGAGKSYAFRAVKDAYEAEGFRVVAVAPTNTVANDLGRDGFKEASTIHSALGSQDAAERRSSPLRPDSRLWRSKTVILVDEAGMVDTKTMARLLEKAKTAGAKVIFSGDDRQLNSVEYGGLYTEFRNAFGSADLEKVRRQSDDWAREASQQCAKGEFREALKAYDSRGYVHDSDSTQAAKDELVKDWIAAQKTDPETSRFVYTQTNKDVNELNERLRAARLEMGQIGQGTEFETVRGKIEVGQGDRIQFYQTQKKAGIFNSAVGTVEKIEGGRITAKMDDGKHVTFDARQYKHFGHGYAGTVYRGQGKTIGQVLYLHSKTADNRTSYVGLTRHKGSLDIYYGKDQAKSLDSLARQMGRNRARGSSLRFADEAEANRIKAQLRTQQKQEGPQQRQTAPAQAAEAEPQQQTAAAKMWERKQQKAQAAPKPEQTQKPAAKLWERMEQQQARAAKERQQPRKPEGMDRFGRDLSPEMVRAHVATHPDVLQAQEFRRQALDRVYDLPDQAGARFDDLAKAQGINQAVSQVKADPTILGQFRADALKDGAGDQVAEACRKTAEAEGRAALFYRNGVTAQLARDKELSLKIEDPNHGMVPPYRVGKPLVDSFGRSCDHKAAYAQADRHDRMAQARARVNAQIGATYADPDHAQAKIWEAVEKEGYDAARAKVRANPEAFGQLRGKHGVFGADADRKAAQKAAKGVSETLEYARATRTGLANEYLKAVRQQINKDRITVPGYSASVAEKVRRLEAAERLGNKEKADEARRALGRDPKAQAEIFANKEALEKRFGKIGQQDKARPDLKAADTEIRKAKWAKIRARAGGLGRFAGRHAAGSLLRGLPGGEGIMRAYGAASAIGGTAKAMGQTMKGFAEGGLSAAVPGVGSMVAGFAKTAQMAVGAVQGASHGLSNGRGGAKL